MFDTLVVVEPDEGPDPWLSDELAPGFVEDLEHRSGRECAEDMGDAPLDGGAPPSVPTMASGVPSGWLALELDAGTADLGRLDDAAVIEAIMGFDRVSSWALARQARLLAELA